jgi:hypothetical protein
MGNGTLQTLVDLPIYITEDFSSNLVCGSKGEQKVFFTESKLMPGRCAAQSHLRRFTIVKETKCVYGFETVDHFVGYYKGFETQKHRLTDALSCLFLKGLSEKPKRMFLRTLNGLSQWSN